MSRHAFGKCDNMGLTPKFIIKIMVNYIKDRAGFSYLLAQSVEEAKSRNSESYVTFHEDGTPIVVREGGPCKSSFFHDGNGRWAKLINSTDQQKVAKVLSKAENPAIALQDGKIVCQFVPMTGIVWHDEKGRKFFLASPQERAELQYDNLTYVTAESDGTYEGLRYSAFDGAKEIPVPRYLYNEKNRKFIVGANFKQLAYAELRKRGNASIAIKNSLRPVYARLSEEGEFIMAHTFGAYEAQETAKGNGSWFVDYCEGGNGGWEVSQEEFFKRYEFYSVAEDGRAVFIAKAARYVWCHLFGDYIGCIPQWGDSMVAMSNPQVNITNPDDVYACSYIEFFGKEDVAGAYIVVEQLFLGAPEPVILEFTEALSGFISLVFKVPKQQVSASNLSTFIAELMAVPSDEKLQKKLARAITV